MAENPWQTSIQYSNGIFLRTPVIPPDSLTEGLKYDEEKSPIDLVDSAFLEGVANVLAMGAKKYSRHNWRRGIAYSRLIAATYRHLGAINKGEDLDSESGLPHVHHLACCVMFLSWMMQNKPELDDRWKPCGPA